MKCLLAYRCRPLPESLKKEQRKKEIIDVLTGEATLRSKKQLIEKFINENLPNIDVDDVTTEFEGFWNAERQKTLEAMCKEEGLAPEKMQSIIEQYLFTEREPLRGNVISLLDNPPTILQRKKIADKIIAKMKDFVSTFLDGMGM